MELGDYLKQLRKERGLGLRAFCVQNGLDPGNYCRAERGTSIPGERELLRYAEALGFAEWDEQWYEMVDMASAAKGKMPSDLMLDPEFVKKLPLVFKAMRRGLLMDLVERIAEEW